MFQLQSMAKQLGLERVRVGWGNRGKGSSPQGWSFEQLWDLQEPGPGGSAAPPAAFPVETHPREDWKKRNLHLTQLSLFFLLFFSFPGVPMRCV